jgi:hypothetical protein
MRNPCIEAAIAELRDAGVYDYELARGGKHPQIHWGANGARRFYALPGTPSDWRSVQNVRADIRRILKADGCIPAAEPAAERSPPRAPSLAQRVARLERLVEELMATINSAGPNPAPKEGLRRGKCSNCSGKPKNFENLFCSAQRITKYNL